MTGGFADYRFRFIFEIWPLTPVKGYGASRLRIENFIFLQLTCLNISIRAVQNDEFKLGIKEPLLLVVSCPLYLPVQMKPLLLHTKLSAQSPQS